VGPTAGLDDVEKRKVLTLQGLEFEPLGRPARSQSLYELSYPGSLCIGEFSEEESWSPCEDFQSYVKTLCVLQCSECVPQLLINPIIRTRTRLISALHVTAAYKKVKRWIFCSDIVKTEFQALMRFRGLQMVHTPAALSSGSL
jgi:hypothetical protein